MAMAKESISSSTTATTFPDLSLQISPPSSLTIDESMRKNLLREDSGSSGSEMSHELGFLHRPDPNPNPSLGEPQLSLRFEAPATDQVHGRMYHQLVQQHLDSNNSFHDRDHHLYRPQIYGFKQNSRPGHGGKRSVRAPRMRWTTTLHSHFVHAVELLGGHESKIFTNYNIGYIYGGPIHISFISLNFSSHA